MSIPLITTLSGGPNNLAARVLILENNESYYQIFEYVGASPSGTITIPTEASIFDVFGDGVLDAISVEADINNNPTDVESTEAGGAVVEVTSLNGAGDYVLSGTPSKNACILYFIKIKDKFKTNIPEASIVSPGIPLNQSPYGQVTAAASNADYTSVKAALDFANAQATSSNPIVVRAFGNFVEAPFGVGPYVILRGENCLISPSDQNSPLCTINSFGEVWGCRFVGPTNSYAIFMNSFNSSFKNGAVLSAGLNGFYLGPSASFIVIRDTTITSQSGVAIDADGATLTQIVNIATLNCGIGINVDNASSINMANVAGVGNAIDFKQSDQNSVVVANACSFNEDKMQFENAQNLRMAFNSDKVGDISLNNLQEFRVGTAEQGYEAVFGEGDSYTRGMMAYTRDTLNAYVDVSIEAASGVGSSLALPGVSVDNMLYLSTSLKKSTGAFLQFFGFKHKVLTAMSGGSIVIEYYNAVNGWTSADYMETQSDRRFYQYGKNAFEHTGDFHIRGPIQLSIATDPNVKWDLSDDPGTGTPTYWVRIRVTSLLTVAPIWEQFKLHSNRSEFNPDGWCEYFGSSRPEGLLPLSVGTGRELAGSIGNRNMWVNENTGSGYSNNRLTLTNQYFGWVEAIPDDLDTGSLISIKFAVRPNIDQIGVQYQFFYDIFSQGDSAFIVNPALSPGRNVVQTIPRNVTEGIWEFFEVDLDVSTARARKDPADGDTSPDVLAITLNPVVLPGETSIGFAEAKYYKWCEGGHI